jgi:hypothetical protein
MWMFDAIMRVDYGAFLKDRLALDEYDDCDAWEGTNGTPDEGARFFCAEGHCPCTYDGQQWRPTRIAAGLVPCEKE